MGAAGAARQLMTSPLLRLYLQLQPTVRGKPLAGVAACRLPLNG